MNWARAVEYIKKRKKKMAAPPVDPAEFQKELDNEVNDIKKIQVEVQKLFVAK